MEGKLEAQSYTSESYCSLYIDFDLHVGPMIGTFSPAITTQSTKNIVELINYNDIYFEYITINSL